MTGWLVRMIGGVLRGASTHRHPSAIALAITFGLAIGLIPKDNLIVLGLAASMWFFRMNYLLALVLIAAISGSGSWTDAATGKVGKWMLENPSLQSLWHRIAMWPILPWFRWNNTVVLGGFLIGTASLAPVYAICKVISRNIIRSRTERHVDALVDEMKGYQSQIQANQRKRQTTASNSPNMERGRSIKKRDPQRHRIDATPAGETIKPNINSPRPEPAMAVLTTEALSQSGSAVLQETVIEIVRYRPKGRPSLPTKYEDSKLNSNDIVKTITPMNTITSVPKDPVSPQSNLKTYDPRDLEPSHLEGQSERDPNLMSIDQEPIVEKPREEALRYLLWHLSGMHRQPRQEESVS